MAFHLNWRERGWVLVLAALALVGCLGTIVVFSPGYISADAALQLKQALGDEPLTDWHPPAMSLLWKGLIWLTGTAASMAALQAMIIWGALFVIAWCVWELTGRRAVSLAVLAIALAPYVLNFVGVVWKDVQMAFAFLAAAAIAILAMRVRSRGPAVRWTLFVLGLAFVVYGILVRKNAIFAALPVFVMLVLALWPRPKRQVWLISAAALVLGLVVPSVAISAIAAPRHENQISQVMLDDLLNVASIETLRSADVSPELRRQLVQAAERCKRKNVLSNTYWDCYGGGANGPYTAVAHPDEIQSLWLREIPSHVPAYVEYRVQVFSRLLFKTKYLYAGRVVRDNGLGLRINYPRLEDTLQTYVEGTSEDLGWLFKGWLWLTVGVVLSIRPGRGLFSMPIRALGISSVIYILGYLPILPVNIYRYVYWPAIAGSLGLILLWAGRERSAAGEPERAQVAEPARTSENGTATSRDTTVAEEQPDRIG